MEREAISLKTLSLKTLSLTIGTWTMRLVARLLSLTLSRKMMTLRWRGLDPTLAMLLDLADSHADTQRGAWQNAYVVHPEKCMVCNVEYYVQAAFNDHGAFDETLYVGPDAHAVCTCAGLL